MPFKDLEHDGGEDFFVDEKTREIVKKEKFADKSKQPNQEEVFDRLNKLWLNLENFALWDGDF